MRPVTDYDRGVFQTKLDAGLSIRQIAGESDFARGTVERHLAPDRPLPSEIKAENKIKRAANVSPEILRRRKWIGKIANMVRRVKRSSSCATVYKKDPNFKTVSVLRYPSARDMITGLEVEPPKKGEPSIYTSLSTINRDLKTGLGKYPYVRKPTPPLSKLVKKQRVTFAKEMLLRIKRNPALLHRFVFTDETYVSTVDQRCRTQWQDKRKKGVKPPMQHLEKKHKQQQPPKAGMWSGIGMGRKLYTILPTWAAMNAAERKAKMQQAKAKKAKAKKLSAAARKKLEAKEKKECERLAAVIAAAREKGVKVPATALNAEEKQPKMLNAARFEKYVLELMADELSADGVIMIQDNFSAHKCPETTAALERLHITMLDVKWPPNSPDLNPIEALFAIIKPRVSWHVPRGLPEVHRFLECEMEALEQETVDKLVQSFVKRLQMCVEAKGESIKLTKGWMPRV